MISCGEKKTETEEVLRPIRYQTVGASSSDQVRSFSGIAKAGDEIELSFRSNGIVTEINGKAGDKVNKGDLIARLDNVQAKLAYEQAVSALSTAKSAMNTAKSALDRVKSLYEKGSNSLSDYEAAKNTFQSASDQYESAKRNKSIQQTQIDYGYIYAPKSGILADVPGGLNENATAGQVIAVLNAGDETNIEVGLPENVINKVSLGMATSIHFSAIEEKKFAGTVIEVSPITDENSASYTVKVGIDDATKEIKPGMSGHVTFHFPKENSDGPDALIIPVSSVGEDGNGNFVFLVESEDGVTGTIKKQQVSLGKLSTDGFEVLEGLS